MAADIRIQRVTGASGSQSITNVTTATSRLNTLDVPADGINNPVGIPTSGNRYSYWGNFRVFCIAAPATAVNSLRLYSDGTNSNAPNVDLNVSTVAGTNGDTTTNYTQATGTPGTTGLEMGANYGHSITTPVSVFTYTSAAMLTVNGAFTTGTDTPSSTALGAFGDWIVLQTKVSTGATAGATTAETMTLVYDEF